MTKKDLKRLHITCGDEYFYQRYIACLIIHGQSMQQAFRTYVSNVEEWSKTAYEIAEEKIEGSISVQDMQRLLNICYIEAMAESIETWIQCLMEETGKTRSEIEVLISVTIPKDKIHQRPAVEKEELEEESKEEKRDLIKKSSAIDAMWNLWNEHVNDASKFTEGEAKAVNKAFKYLQKKLEGLPADYDVEKVMAELEEEKQSDPCRNTQCKYCNYTKQCYEGEMCYKVGFDNAIEKVRKGGVE